MKSSDDGRDEFRCRLKIVRYSSFRMRVGSSFHQPGTVNENVLESDFEPLCDDTTRRRSLADLFWRGCRLSSVNGSRRVRSLWLFYMQALVSWTWCEFKHVLYASWLPAGGFNSWDGGGGGLQKRTPISQSFSLYIHQLSYICTYVSVCVCENLS